MTTTVVVDELDVHRGVCPFERDAGESYRRGGQVYPGVDGDRLLAAARAVRGEIDLYGAEAQDSRCGRDLLASCRDLLVDAVRIASIGAHAASVEQMFDTRWGATNSGPTPWERGR